MYVSPVPFQEIIEISSPFGSGVTRMGQGKENAKKVLTFLPKAPGRNPDVDLSKISDEIMANDEDDASEYPD